MEENSSPALFGLKNSNRDFTKPKFWGKNQFNSAFPASLACYMFSKGLKAKYLSIDNQYRFGRSEIGFDQVLGINPLSNETHYGFETNFLPYSNIVRGKLPRADLVVSKLVEGSPQPISAFEIKLTVNPDSNSGAKGPGFYGPEIVLRPDSVLYLALSIASGFKDDREKLLDITEPLARKIYDWSNPGEMQTHLDTVRETLIEILSSTSEKQKPYLLQPIWATKGQSYVLEEQCFDIFVWSDYALTQLFVPRMKSITGKSDRPSRSGIWLFKMLYDYALTGKIDEEVRHTIAFGAQTDKAFSASGQITRPLLSGESLDNLRVHRDEIANIILGGGEKYLMPERRFDGAIYTSPALFHKIDKEI